MLGLLRLKFVLLAGGIALLVYGGKEMMLSSKGSVIPQTIKCADLIAKGPGNNAHIVLTDFVPVAQYFVCRGKNDKGPWKEVYMPAVEAGGEWHMQVLEKLRTEGNNIQQLPEPQNVRVLLKLTDVLDEAHMNSKVEPKTLEGTIINSITSLSGEEARILRHGYPQLNVESCYVLEVGRKPNSPAFAIGMLALGMLGTVAGILSFRR